MYAIVQPPNIRTDVRLPTQLYEVHFYLVIYNDGVNVDGSMHAVCVSSTLWDDMGTCLPYLAHMFIALVALLRFLCSL